MREETKKYTPIMVDIKDLQDMLGVSKNVAMRIGQEAGAVVRLGIRRTLYNVEKVKAYIDNHTGGLTNDI